MAPVLEIQNLSTHIKLTSSVVQAVGNIDLQVDAGELVCLLGGNASGKSSRRSLRPSSVSARATLVHSGVRPIAP